MFKDENLVTHDHSHQRDDTHHRGKTQRTVHQPQTDKCTRNHESKSSNANECDTILLKVEQQEEEHDNHRYGNATKNLGNRLAVVFYLATNFSTYTLGQVYLVLHDFSHTTLDRSSIDSLGKLSSHRDTTLTTTMHDATLCPLRLHLGNLAEGHGGVS